MTINTSRGTLYLIPVTLGDDNINQVLPAEVIKIAQNLENFVVESEKSARHFLSTIKTAKPVRELTLNLLNEHTLDKDVAALLAPLLAGKDDGCYDDQGDQFDGQVTGRNAEEFPKEDLTVRGAVSSKLSVRSGLVAANIDQLRRLSAIFFSSRRTSDISNASSIAPLRPYCVCSSRLRAPLMVNPCS